MAESAVLFLGKQLSVWLQEEQNLLLGLEQETEYIRDELGNMRAFLRVADAKQENDPQLEQWVRQVRDITYDTEDVLEKYMLRFAYPRYGANGFNRCIKRILASVMSSKARHQIASEIQTIKSRVENVSRSQQRFRDMYAIVNQSSSSTPTGYQWSDDDSRGDALLLEEEEVVGIKKPKQQLLDWLLSATDGLSVISVVGMGGLGKTTLVKKVYDDTSVKANFDCHVWVTVSASFKAEHLLRDIIKRLDLEGKQKPPQGLESMNVDDLKEFVYNFLQHKKTYIIVLDDVWKIDAWESIRYGFPRSSIRGSIIITTRLSDIGNAACTETNGHVYYLQPLNAEKSEKLFYKKAFPRNSCPPSLKEISQSILKRCEGLPLAIVIIGGLLATKNNNYDEWQMFKRNIGPELEGDNLKRMRKLLSLSYYDLPYYLKSCFLYLSIFPKDARFEKWRIIRLWIAEGFVEVKQGKTVEEVAEGYLNELLNRNLIQVAQRHNDGRPRKFRIHDILREYIISKSREHSVIAIASGEEVRLPDKNKIRQMAIHTTFNHTQESYNVRCLRSLLWLELIDSKSGSILRKILLGNCRLLKVLDVRGAPLDSIPDEVFKLFHLKYLSLRRTNIKIIPKSIENLENLETLDLKKSKVTELPIEILKLRKLRHLLVYSYGNLENPSLVANIESFKAPYEIGRYLTALQKLCYIDADEVKGIKIVREIGKLTQLRRLGITKLRREDGKDLCFSLAKLINLRSLSVSSIKEGEVMDLDHSLTFPFPLPVLRKLLLKGCLEKVPEWVHSLNGLTELFLGWSRLREDPLQHLGVLPNLVYFSMHKFAYEGEELSFNSGGFQRLRRLRLESLKGLRWIRVEDGSIPHLTHLDIEDCKLMEELPNGIEHLKELEYVRFINMSQEFFFGLSLQRRKGGEEWKLAHVTQVQVYDCVDGWQTYHK